MNTLRISKVGALACSVVSAVALSLLVVMIVPVDAQELSGSVEIPVVVTAGTGAATVPPDVAKVDFRVSANGRKAADAAGKNTATVSAVLDSLLHIGFGTESITTSGHNVRPMYKEKRGKRKITGYRSSTKLTVTVEELDQVGGVVDTALKAGATSLERIRFEAINPIDARERAITKAVDVARHTAESLAEAAGGRLGRLLLLSTVREPYPRHSVAASQVTIVPVIPPDIVVKIDVTARWEFIGEH